MAADRNGRPHGVKVVLDANALMMPGKFRIDLIESLRDLLGAFEPVILEEVLREIAGLAQGHGSDAAAARVGLVLAARFGTVESECTGETVDERIACYAIRNEAMVATNDRGLREKLLAKGIAVISMKKQKKLDIIRR